VLIAFTNRRAPAPPPSSDRISVSTASTAGTTAPAQPHRTAGSKCTLLLAPEIFSSVGGIPRILQLYLKALSEIAAERGEGLRLIALNDPVLDTTDVRRYTQGGLDDWLVCGRKKGRFVRGVIRLSPGCDRIVCGHIGQLPVAWAARRLHPRLRYYLVAHGIEVWRPFNLIERLALRGAEKIFCVSEYTRRELLKRCALPEGRTVVLPNALDPYFVIEPGLPIAESPPTILTVTRLTYDDRYKGVEHLIAAMPRVRAAVPEANLRIIGRGDDLRRLQGIARDHGVLDAGVQFLGFASDQQMTAELRSCRLFALPSKKEGFGLVFLEAMAHGRPCLGAEAGGIPEVITPETGVLVEFGNVPALADACIAALGYNWSKEAILDRARHFSYSPFKERLASLLAP